MNFTKRERQFLEGKLKLEKGSMYERRLKSNLRKKIGTAFAVVCVYCEQATSDGQMWEIKAGDNVVFACTTCAKNRLVVAKVTVTQEGIKRPSQA